MKVPDFPCPSGGHPDEIPSGGPFPEVYLQPDVMAQAAVAASPMLPSLPFDCVLEAEAAGAEINGYEDRFGLRVRRPTGVLQVPDFTTARPQAVLAGLEQIAAAGAPPCLMISGPGSVANQLLGMESFLLQWRRGETAEFFAGYQQALVAYVKEAVARGTRVLSYSDPVAALYMLGPKYADAFCRQATVPLLQALAGLCTIHLCGKTSAVLCHSGLAYLQRLPLPQRQSYVEAVAQIEGAPLLGHGCIKAGGQTDHLTALCWPAGTMVKTS